MKINSPSGKLFSISLAHFVNDFFMASIPPIMFIFAKELGMNMTMESIAAFFITVGGTLFQPIIGLLLDKYGKSSYVMVGILWIGIGMSLAGFVKNYYLFLALTSISALASAVFHPLGSYLVANLRDSSRGKSMSFFMTLGGLAYSVTPLITLPIATNLGVEYLIILIIPALITVLLLHLSGVNNIDMAFHREKMKHENIKLSIRQKWDLSNVTLVSVLKGFVSSVLLVFGIKILQIKGLSIMEGGFILSLYLFIRTLGTLSGGYLTDKIGHHAMMIYFNALMSLFLGIFVFFDGYIAAFGLVLMGFSHSASSTSNVMITHAIAPQRANFGTGLILGLSATISGLMMMPFGYLSDKVGLDGSLAIIFWIGLIPTIVSLFLKNYDRKEDVNEYKS
jgi:FSR family fosmidomycin resistance protein-like MFS transporter